MSNRIRFRKGSHYDRNWLSSWPFFGAVSIKRRILFPAASRYVLATDDPTNQSDYNKMFGVAWGWNGLLKGMLGWQGPHGNSLRLGCAYHPGRDQYDLAAYIYENGVRRCEPLGSVSLDRYYEAEMREFRDGYVRLSIRQLDGTLVGCCWFQVPPGTPRWGITLGGYFGGQDPAPHPVEWVCERAA